jgi:phosphatidylglycerol:prolipoprotein diacylglycerol transferase
MTLDFVTWNVDPEIVGLGPISLRWYGLLFASSFVFGYIIFKKFFKDSSISEEVLDKLILYMVLGTVVGARLGHVLFYDPGYYFANPWEIIMIQKGGLASHGAAIGILIAIGLFVRKFKMNFLWMMDRIAIVVALSGFFIRLGNLMNSEIYGIETNLPWGFIFARDGQVLPKHPTQIYEALSYLAIFILLMVFYKRKIFIDIKGKIFSIFLILLFVARFLIEYIKNPQEDFEKALPLDMGQWLSLPFIILGIFLYFYQPILIFIKRVSNKVREYYSSFRNKNTNS